MPNKIEVMLDRAANNLSIISADDTDGREVETTLSLEEAWALVSNLNQAIQRLLPKSKYGGSLNKTLNSVDTVAGANNPFVKSQNPEQLREAVLHSVDSKRYQNTAN